MNRFPTYLFVLPWSIDHVGGVNRVVINLCREMKACGLFEPVVLISDWDAAKPSFGECLGIKTVRWRIRSWRPGLGFKERVVYWFWVRGFIAKFRRFCSENNVISINPHFPEDYAFALESAVRRCSSPPRFVLSFHGSDVNALQNAPELGRRMWTELLMRADGVVACSIDLASLICSTFGGEIRPTVIYNGVDRSAFVTPDGCVARVGKRRRILNVGKFDPVKGQDVLLRAFHMISSEFADVDLVIVGASGSSLEALQRLRSELGLNERVEFKLDIPYEQMPSVFSSANLFVLSSRREAFPLVLLEAGALGLPVIASRVGGVPEVIVEGETGALVDAEDAVMLSCRIRSFLLDPDYAVKLGRRLRERVASSFTWGQACSRYMALSGLLGECSPAGE